MKQNSYADIFTNPLFIAGSRITNPLFGEQLAAAALEQRQQQQANLQNQEFEYKQQEALRNQRLAEMMPQILKELDPNDIKGSWNKLIQAGVDPQAAAAVIKNLAEIGFQERELGYRGEELGLKRQNLGLEQQNLSLKARELEQKLSGELSPEDRFKTEQDLRKELSGLAQTKDFQIVKTAYEKVKEIEKNPSPANDIGLIYSVMKIYDPNSVVRETEYATAQNAAGVPERIRTQWNKAISGESLSPKMRKDFLQSAKTVYKGQVKAYKPTASKFENLAKQYSVNPENIIIERPEEITETAAPVANITPQQARAELARRRQAKGL
jgi:hypothetical protein